MGLLPAGDSDAPVWQAEPEAAGEAPSTGYVGKYRGVVVDNADPEQQRRLLVTVPEVFDVGTTAWAASAVPGGSADDPLPEVGSEVWIEFEYGDPQYPTWVGLA